MDVNLFIYNRPVPAAGNTFAAPQIERIEEIEIVKLSVVIWSQQ
jgi:hypothetical protein